ncbi:MAG: hypothetical protein LW870_18185 [Pirellula sp.]|jgi:hypothetical protein|nr:hypothetical protein [Pirellula sp.]
MKSIFRLLLCFHFLSAICFASTPSEVSYEKVKKQLSIACDWLAKGEIEKFVESLPAGTHSVEADSEFRTKFQGILQNQKANIVERYGISLGDVSYVREEASGAYWRKIGYLQRFAKGACYWYFLLYRVEDQWRLTKVQFDPVEAGFTNEPNAISAKDSEPMKLADKFAELFAKDAISEAIETFQSSSELKIDETAVKKLDLTMKLDTLNGNPTRNEFEIVQAETVGPNAVRYHYIIPRLKSASQLQVTLYNGERGWQFYGWSVTNDAPKAYTVMSTNAPLVR